MAENRNYGVGYKATEIPVSVGREFRQAADLAGKTVKGALGALLAPPKPKSKDAKLNRAEWVATLRHRIMAGQRRLGEFVDEKTVTLSTHIPEDYRDAVNEAASSLGVNTTYAGRFILIGLAGRIHEALLAQPGDED